MLRITALSALLAGLIVAQVIVASGPHSSFTTQSIWDDIVGFFSNFWKTLLGSRTSNLSTTTASRTLTNLTQISPYTVQIVSARIVSLGNPSLNATTVGSNVLLEVAVSNTGIRPIYYNTACGQEIVFNVTPAYALNVKHNWLGNCQAQANMSVLYPNATVTLKAPYLTNLTIAVPENATAHILFYWSKSNSSDTARFQNATFSTQFDFIPYAPPTQQSNSTTTVFTTTAAGLPTTTAATTTTVPSSTSASTTTSTTTVPAGPAYAVQILSAQTVSYADGTPGVTAVGSQILFKVTFENAGTQPIYYGYGCGMIPLSFSITPSSSVNYTSGGGAQCPRGFSPSVLYPGENASVYAPNLGPATIAQAVDANAEFTLYWSKTNSTAGPFSTTSYSTTFNFH